MSRPVKSARFATGVQIGSAVELSYFVGKQGVISMEVTLLGLTIRTADREYIVPFGNISQIEILQPEAYKHQGMEEK